MTETDERSRDAKGNVGGWREKDRQKLGESKTRARRVVSQGLSFAGEKEVYTYLLIL